MYKQVNSQVRQNSRVLKKGLFDKAGGEVLLGGARCDAASDTLNCAVSTRSTKKS